MYKTLSGYLKEKYGGKIKKICIDGGFTCPNRDGKCGVGGCTYCGERGAGEHIDEKSGIREQVRAGLDKTRADGYIAYFQNFTNTYASPEVLRERYDAALFDERIKVLAIGTRPDCIDEEICRLLCEYKARVDVWVELGLQTASDQIAERINRGYKSEVYLQAAKLLTEHGIPFVTHIMIGLPGECEADVDKTVDMLNEAGSWGVKIHSVYVMRGTALEAEYHKKLYTPPTMEEYVRLAARTLSRLKKNIVVHRITGDCPRGMLVAPEWNTEKNALIAAIRAEYAALTEGR